MNNPGFPLLTSSLSFVGFVGQWHGGTYPPENPILNSLEKVFLRHF